MQRLLLFALAMALVFLLFAQPAFATGASKSIYRVYRKNIGCEPAAWGECLNFQPDSDWTLVAQTENGPASVTKTSAYVGEFSDPFDEIILNPVYSEHTYVIDADGNFLVDGCTMQTVSCDTRGQCAYGGGLVCSFRFESEQINLNVSEPYECKVSTYSPHSIIDIQSLGSSSFSGLDINVIGDAQIVTSPVLSLTVGTYTREINLGGLLNLKWFFYSMIMWRVFFR